MLGQSFTPANLAEQASNLKNTKAAGKFLKPYKKQKNLATQNVSQTAAEAWSDLNTQANQSRLSGEGPSMAQTNSDVPGTMEAAGKLYDQARGNSPTYGVNSDNDRNQFLQAYAELRTNPKYADKRDANGDLLPGVWSALVSKVQARHGHGGAGAVQEITNPEPDNLGDEAATGVSTLVKSTSELPSQLAGAGLSAGAEEALGPNHPATETLRATGQTLGAFSPAWPLSVASGIAEGGAENGVQGAIDAGVGAIPVVGQAKVLLDPKATREQKIGAILGLGLIGGMHVAGKVGGQSYGDIVDSAINEAGSKFGPETAQAVHETLNQSTPEQIQQAIHLHEPNTKPFNQESFTKNLQSQEIPGAQAQMARSGGVIDVPQSQNTGYWKERTQGAINEIDSYLKDKLGSGLNLGRSKKVTPELSGLKSLRDELAQSLNGDNPHPLILEEMQGGAPSIKEPVVSKPSESTTTPNVIQENPVIPEQPSNPIEPVKEPTSPVKEAPIAQGTTNAVQEQTTGKMGLRDQTTLGGQVGKNDTTVGLAGQRPTEAKIENPQPGAEDRVPQESQGESQTTLTHEGTEAIRAAIPELTKYVKNGTSVEQVIKDAQPHIETAVDLARRTLDNPRPWTAKEQVGALIKAHQLSQEVTAGQADIAKAIESGDVDGASRLLADNNQRLSDLDALALASDKAGSEAGLSLRMRQLQASGPIDSTNVRDRAVVAKKGPLTADESKTVEELRKKLKEAEDAHAATKADNASLKEKLEKALAQRKESSRLSPRVQKLQPKYEAALKRLQQNAPTSKTTGASINVPQHIVDLGTVLHYNIVKGMRDYGALFQAAKDIKGNLTEPDFKQALRLALQEYHGKKIETREEAEARVQEQRAKDESSRYIKQLEYQSMDAAKKFGQQVQAVIGSPKSLKFSGAPFHAVFRHLAPKVLTGSLKPVASGIAGSAKTLVKGEAAGLDAVRQNPYYDLAKAVKLPGLDGHGSDFIPETGVGAKIKNTKAYDIASRGKQAFGVSIARARMTDFANLARLYDETGTLTIDKAKEIRDFVSDTTGHGRLNSIGEQSAPFLNNLFSSIRLLSSRYRILTGQTFGKAIKSGGFDPRDPLAGRAMKDAVTLGLAMVTLTKLGIDKKVDLTGGLDSMLKIIGRAVSDIKNHQSDVNTPNSKDREALFNWLGNHASPQVQGLFNAASGEDPFTREKTNLAKEVVKMYEPLPLEETTKRGSPQQKGSRFLGGQIGAFVKDAPKASKSKSPFKGVKFKRL